MLDWHSEEALNTLIEKYDNLILIKLNKFNVLKTQYNDYIQELRMTILEAIRKYNDNYGKTLCRYLELIIERKIMRMMSEDVPYSARLVYIEDSSDCSGYNVLEEMICEEKILQIKSMELDNFQRALLKEVILEGESVKQFAEEHDITSKQVYNHVYSLRLKIKRKINL